MIPILEMIQRYRLALVENQSLLVLAMILSVFVIISNLFLSKIRFKNQIAMGLFLITVSLALVWAWDLKWVGDDAFISFRYAKNFARGDGLVFNVVERVEGYTNFLWTVIIADAISLGFDPAQFSIILSLLCFAGVLFLTFRLSSFNFTPHPNPLPQGEREPIVLSLAVLLLAANYTMASFATSGLETMFSTFLVVLALERMVRGRPFQSGLAGIAATMAHPDHALFYVALGGALLLNREKRQGIIKYALPFVMIYVPYFLWRWHYYGDFFPNTFYAKSAGTTYFSQGGIYLAASLIGGGLWGVLPLFFIGLYQLRKSFLFHYFALLFPLYLIYVAKIGGDFMFGRLLCPLLPFLFLIAEKGTHSLLSQRKWVFLSLGVLLSTASALPTKIIQPWEKKWHLADERTFYNLSSFSPIHVDSFYTGWSATINRTLVYRKLRPKMAIESVGIISYLVDLPIVDYFGLTNREIAHQPTTMRGRPGHEKFATPEMIIKSGALLAEVPTYPEPYASLTRIQLEGVPFFFLVRYDPSLMGALKGAGDVQFLDFPLYLDDYIKTISSKNKEGIRRDLDFFDAYYFSMNEDPERRAKIFESTL